MILVIVGLVQAYERLIKKMDEISQHMDEEIIIQLGKTKYIPKNASYFNYKSEKEFRKLFEDARLIVCHCGVGTILTALEKGKPVVVLPRKKEYSEHIDDHQLELAKELEKDERIKVIYDENKLNTKLFENIIEYMPNNNSNNNSLVIKLRFYLDNLQRCCGECNHQ
jgi:beta-1,4-N-acetylglucosaminyltransferase